MLSWGTAGLLDAGGRLCVSFHAAALVTLLTGAVGHWCGTTGAAAKEPGICLHPEAQAAGANWMMICVYIYHRLRSSAQ